MVLFMESEAYYIGAIYALACSLPLILFEVGRLLPNFHERIQKLPTPGYIAGSLISYVVLSCSGFALAGTLLKLSGLIQSDWRDVLIQRPATFLYTLSFFFAGITLLRIRQLLGREVFSSLVTGRYRKPLREERVFLFIDVIGSTSYARQFGDLRAQEFLGEIFASFAAHVRAHDGEIDDYVGDCAIITWRMKIGVDRARCVVCLCAILEELECNKDWWIQQFGRVPKICAALHGGVVVTAAIGLFHQKITYFGDVVNTTARIEGLCKTLEEPVLISAELLARLNLPDNVTADSCGAHTVKGHDAPLTVFALRQVPG
ncbi:adenylate/guanylate cyclase domain-containing protein [Rhizobium lemnae]|uniref:Adenylate/guanylate cyclase domain-containing protein n=1 Tax=Rhizobium lemnae TaxID=1214924 RepID=A0ABV8EB53_9HYPH|nr:adenylate/guanylate cyclase domain-containing protein [Rhizobium lemnae]MCJ8508110.1 adenylate/guanylate cyclase domain-containing protein [Rhizobium lemnae]